MLDSVKHILHPVTNWGKSHFEKIPKAVQAEEWL